MDSPYLTPTFSGLHSPTNPVHERSTSEQAAYNLPNKVISDTLEERRRKIRDFVSLCFVLILGSTWPRTIASRSALCALGTFGCGGKADQPIHTRPLGGRSGTHKRHTAILIPLLLGQIKPEFNKTSALDVFNIAPSIPSKISFIYPV
jgi:hypothetical protein